MEILMVLNRSKVNNNIWLWSNNEAFPDPEKNMINTLQNYYEEMYNDKSQEALESLEVTSIRQIDLYPKIIFAYDNLAVAYSIRNDFDNALKYLFMALNINVNDPVVIGNIANTYRRKGDIENAKKYYQILFDMKIEPYSSKAKNMLNKL
jgi:tetratricopeptide (TPR) repeat protein